MKLTAAKCPSCGADIEVDKNSDKTKCEFCDSSIIVEDAIAKYKVELSGEVTVKNLPQIESLMKLADRSYDTGEYSDAYDKYDKVLELDTDNLRAILRKAFCKCFLRGIDKFDLNIIITANDIVFKIYKDNKNEIDNCISLTLPVLEYFEIELDTYCSTNPAPNQAVLNDQFKTFLDILEYKNSLFSMSNNDNLSKHISQSIVKTSAYSYKKRNHMYITSKGYLTTNTVRNPYYGAAWEICNKHSQMLNPTTQKTVNKTNNKSVGLKIGAITIIIVIGAVVVGFFVLCFLIIIIAALFVEPYYGDTYTYENQSIEFYSSSKLYYDDGNGSKEYAYKSIKKGSVYTITFGEYTFIYDNGLCKAEDNKCVEDFKKKSG